MSRKWLVLIQLMIGIISSFPAYAAMDDVVKTTATLNNAAINGDIETAKKAVEAGADINEVFFFLTPLYMVASHGHADFIEWAVKAGADIEYKNGPSQRTALHEAVFKGHMAAAKKLLELGASPNPTNTHGRTPLFYAYFHEGALRDELIFLLLANGAEKIEPPSDEAKEEIRTGINAAMTVMEELKPAIHDLFRPQNNEWKSDLTFQFEAGKIRDFKTMPLADVIDYIGNQTAIFSPMEVMEGVEARYMFLHNNTLIYSYNLTGDAISIPTYPQQKTRMMEICGIPMFRRINDEGFSIKGVYYSGNQFISISTIWPCECMEDDKVKNNRRTFKSEALTDEFVALMHLREDDPEVKKCREKSSESNEAPSPGISDGVAAGRIEFELKELEKSEKKLVVITVEDVKKRLDLEDAKHNTHINFRSQYNHYLSTPVRTAFWLSEKGVPSGVVKIIVYGAASAFGGLLAYLGWIFFRWPQNPIRKIYRKFWHRKIFRAWVATYLAYALLIFTYLGMADTYVREKDVLALLTLPPAGCAVLYWLHRWYRRGV